MDALGWLIQQLSDASKDLESTCLCSPVLSSILSSSLPYCQLAATVQETHAGPAVFRGGRGPSHPILSLFFSLSL